MTNILSFSPLMRSSIGFDRFDEVFQSLIEDKEERLDTYPPYNIEKTAEDRLRIVMAVAGFSQNEIDITAQRDTLTITGKAEETRDSTVSFLHRGIAARSFQRTFRLADHIKVMGAEMHDGLLTIHLVHEVPEEAKPRTITINGTNSVAIDKQKVA